MLLLACALLLLVSPHASARGRGGAVFVSPGFGWGWGGGWYDPFWGPYPYAYDGFGYPSTGTVKFDTNNKDAGVYIAGGYAGTVGQLKSLHLRPGTYNIELRGANNSPYTVKVYVAAGKTVHINPNVAAPSQP